MTREPFHQAMFTITKRGDSGPLPIHAAAAGDTVIIGVDREHVAGAALYYGTIVDVSDAAVRVLMHNCGMLFRGMCIIKKTAQLRTISTNHTGNQFANYASSEFVCEFVSFILKGE